MAKKKKMSRKDLLEMSDKDFAKFTVKTIVPSKKKRKKGVYLNFPFDLRSSFDDKINYAATGTSWTAFVNNAGTLAHVMCPEADILIRIKFNFPINALDPKRMKQVVMARISDWVTVA